VRHRQGGQLPGPLFKATRPEDAGGRGSLFPGEPEKRGGRGPLFLGTPVPPGGGGSLFSRREPTCPRLSSVPEAFLGSTAQRAAL
jgi:hypothetical protein